MIPTLPIFATVFGAYRKVFENMGTLIRSTILPMLALLIIGTVQQSSTSAVLVPLLTWLLSLPFITLLAVACHRVFLLGSDSLDSPWSLYWTSRETSFFVWLVILGIFMYVTAWGFGVVFLMSPDSAFGFSTPWLGLLLTYVTVTYFQGRFSMVLPATAVGERMVLSNSWYLTAGSGPQIALALLLPLAVLWFLFEVGGSVVFASSVVAFSILAVIAVMVTAAVEVAVLSLSYRFLKDSALNKR